MTTTTAAGSAQKVQSGYFEVGGQALTFQDLVVLMGFMSLEAQDKTFESMFNEAQNRTEFMNELNDCLQMLNSYKDNFDKDGKATDKAGYQGSSDSLVKLTAEDAAIWNEVYYPKLVRSGLVKDSNWAEGSMAIMGIGSDSLFNKDELNTFIENAKLAQTNMSSTNEQQMIRTNQAANKRGTILQQVQTLLATVKEGNSSAAR
ncbi:MAG: hypothetical protein MI749_09775 [Desulfovibrionales bacterium]|nr:hypothetical protein [Desulfovibrionales bacterium]